MREKKRFYKRIHKKVIATIVKVSGDNRFFAQTKMGGKDVLASLDSGAGACCLGKNFDEILKGKENDIIPISGQNIRTAKVGETEIIRVITLPVVWDDITKDLEFLVVPGLQEDVYLGVDFWITFNFNVVIR